MGLRHTILHCLLLHSLLNATVKTKVNSYDSFLWPFHSQSQTSSRTTMLFYNPRDITFSRCDVSITSHDRYPAIVYIMSVPGIFTFVRRQNGGLL